MSLSSLEPAVIVGHAVSLATILGAASGVLTPLATLFAVVFYAIQIYESRTIQALLHGKAAVQQAETAAALLKVNDARRNVQKAAEQVVAVALAHTADQA